MRIVDDYAKKVTVGLFELAGRYAVAKLMKKKLTWKRSLAAGLGVDVSQLELLRTQLVGMALVSVVLLKSIRRRWKE